MPLLWVFKRTAQPSPEGGCFGRALRLKLSKEAITLFEVDWEEKSVHTRSRS
ncbi:MAG: hypothetical protein GF317_01360 [Candidatus Lokiarchaeota archaeon]|nr:hypothetical protein [Candidatus Lokiarchaeota archaeon]MBD3198592.1 hypothetical protein [Candidatus Lokiarchaeota archaeon]